MAKKQEKEKMTEATENQGVDENTEDPAVKVNISKEAAEKDTDVEETDPLKILEAKVRDAEDAAAQAHDRLLRASAEYDNFKKRSQRETEEFRKFANESLIKDLLPVVDNLERAVESSGTDKASNQGIVEGVEMTLREIYKVLERFNLKPLESEGKPFDPNFHQAVLQEETGEYPENTVLKEMQKGYILHDRLIRPAMVVVSKALSQESEGENSKKAAADNADK